MTKTTDSGEKGACRVLCFSFRVDAEFDSVDLRMNLESYLPFIAGTRDLTIAKPTIIPEIWNG